MYKLLAMDVNGVLVDARNTWMNVHEAFGTLEEGKKLTSQYLTKDYNQLVEEVVVRLWKGKDARSYTDLIAGLPYMRGIQSFFAFVHERDWHVGLISAGTLDAAKRIDEDFGVDSIVSNELVIQDGVVAGTFRWPIGEGTVEKRDAYLSLCDRIGIGPEEGVFVGDSMNDRLALRAAGLGVAFNPRDESLRAYADVVVESNDLRDLVRVLTRTF